MRCFFNLVSDHEIIAGEEAIEVADLDQVQRIAKEAVVEAIRGGEELVTDWPQWSLEAVDASGTVLFAIRFHEVSDERSATAGKTCPDTARH